LDSHGIGSGYHLLPHFNSNTNTDSDIFEYEYKTNVSDLDFYSDIYSSQLKCILLNLTYMNKILLIITSLTKVN
jgi:archaellum biogenesis protein FlaJ (TadC family)